MRGLLDYLETPFKYGSLLRFDFLAFDSLLFLCAPYILDNKPETYSNDRRHHDKCKPLEDEEWNVQGVTSSFTIFTAVKTRNVMTQITSTPDNNALYSWGKKLIVESGPMPRCFGYDRSMMTMTRMQPLRNHTEMRCFFSKVAAQ